MTNDECQEDMECGGKRSATPLCLGIVGPANPSKAASRIACRRTPKSRAVALLILSIGLAGVAMNLHGQVTIPDNDNFATRTALYGTTAPATGNSAGATFEPGEPDPSFLGEKSVWWTWTAPTDGSVTITTAGSNFDTMLTVF